MIRQRSKEEQWHPAVENAGQLPDYLYINGERVCDPSKMVGPEGLEPSTNGL